ncbi:MAG TPA: PQQ-binding-like beta-propeller repeat protein [Candidatus Sulfotelmatobacter sp.]|nr:PQQ-binding-like beta-propeller repeat protein [Candidatus Sulfotelmatobacter sp.]
MNPFSHFRALSLLALLLALPITSRGETWPQFRGPTGQGLSTETNLPIHWSATENLAWKTPIPGDSWSSPIVWNDRVFVTTATDNGVSCHVLCLDRAQGKILWDKEVLRQATTGRKEDRNTYATPTPATDGTLIYSAFFDGTFVALDFSGSVVWTNRDYPFYSQHGLATSPILWQDLLIMARDASSPGENKKLGWQEPWNQSFVVALDKRTGKQRWKTFRGQSRIGHVVPLIHTDESGQTVVLSGAGDVVQAFAPNSGERLWSSFNKGEGVVPSLAAGQGLVFTASGYSGRESIKAFRLGGHGDLQETNLAWEQRKGMPHVPSLLYVKPHLFAVNDAGLSQCLKADTGEILWQERLGGNFSASPVYADGKVYFLSDAGETTVVEAAPQFKVLAKNPLNEKCQSSMAVSQQRLFIRSAKHLFCIAQSR